MIPQTRVWSPKYIKNSHNSTPGRQTIQSKNGQRTWTDTSLRRTYRGPTDRWKKHFSSLWIFLANPFWPAKFLLRNPLTVLWELAYMQLTAFEILSLSLTFYILIMMYLGVDLSCLGLSVLPGLVCLFLSPS